MILTMYGSGDEKTKVEIPAGLSASIIDARWCREIRGHA